MMMEGVDGRTDVEEVMVFCGSHWVGWVSVLWFGAAIVSQFGYLTDPKCSIRCFLLGENNYSTQLKE